MNLHNMDGGKVAETEGLAREAQLRLMQKFYDREKHRLVFAKRGIRSERRNCSDGEESDQSWSEMTTKQRDKWVSDNYVMTTKHKYLGADGRHQKEIVTAIDAVQDYNMERALEECLDDLHHAHQVGGQKKTVSKEEKKEVKKVEKKVVKKQKASEKFLEGIWSAMTDEEWAQLQRVLDL